MKYHESSVKFFFFIVIFFNFDIIIIQRIPLPILQKINKYEINSFASTLNENIDLMQVIFSVLEDKGKHQEFLDPVCHQFFSFYRSKDVALQRFTLQFIPTLIWLYLNSVAHSEKKTFKQVEVLLLGIYNLVIVDEDGNPVMKSFNVPSLSQPSIYHEPLNLHALPLTENMLSKFVESGHIQKIDIGPNAPFGRINADNRLKILTVLLMIYNQNISYMAKPSLQACCKMISKLCKHGFQRSSMQRYGAESNSYSNPHSRNHPRIHVSASFLHELLHAAYFTIFNGLPSVGYQAVEDIKTRCYYQMYPTVMMACNAICSSVKNNPLLQLGDSYLGVGVAVSPSPSATSISKAVITNASFRTKKLPDDISIPNNKDEIVNDGNKATLMSISEDSEDSSQSKSRANSEVSKVKEKSKVVICLPNKKDKTKSKSKEKDQTSETNGSTLSLKSKKDEIVSNRTPKSDRKKSESDFKVSSKYNRASSDYFLSSKFNESKVDTQISVTSSGTEVGVIYRGGDRNRRVENHSRPHSIHSVV
ncbi:Hyccin [Nymphon striatum]|nr:Hyccin [Nymphon striatum]